MPRWTNHFFLWVSFVALLLTTARVSGQSRSGELAPTLQFEAAVTLSGDEVSVAWQSGMPVPSFDPQNRARLNLAGEWRKERVTVDSDLTLSPRDPEGIAALETEAAGRQLSDYDDSQWLTMTLPMVENEMPRIGNPRGPESYEGGVWYRRTFTTDAEWQATRVTLNFLAVNYVVDVWLNGQWVGYHEGGYTPFAFDVSDNLNAGAENTIALRIDNPAWGSRHDIVPAIAPDWWNYTGVIQDFYLEATPTMYVVRADVLTPTTSGAVQARILIHNSGGESQRGQLTLQIHDTDPTADAWLNDPRASAIVRSAIGDALTIDIDVPAGDVQIVTVEMNIPDVALWSPASPNLYVLEASLASAESVDTMMSQFGVRTIATESYHLLLNDEPYFLAGIARHEEWGDSGRSATWDKIRADLEIIRGLGANFVRTAHYPNHLYTYILTDRLGLTAAVEVPMWQVTAVEYQAQAQRQIADQLWREMILSNRNRPSIIMWSSNNESREVTFRREYIERLQADFQTHYPDGRLLMQSAAADTPGVSDASQEPLDLLGWTMYFGIFHGSTYYEGTRDFLQAAHAAFPDRPILNTEFGIWSLGGDSSPRRQLEVFNETFRALAEVSAWDAQGGYNPDGFVAGMVWWTAFDWYSAHSRLQTMGLYEMDRQDDKPVVEAIREAYSVWSPFLTP